MLSPDFKRQITRGLEKLVWDIQDDLVSMLAKELAEYGKLSETAILQLKAAGESGLLYRKVMRLIQKRSKLAENEIKKAFREAQIEQARYDSEIYGHKVTLSPEMANIVKAQYKMTLGEFKNYTRTMGKSACNMYVQATDKAFNQTVSGLKPWTKSFMDAVDEIGEGVTIHYERSGINTTPEVAVARALRTGVAQMASQITATRAAENDVHLFLTSAHDGARPTHEPWQGQVFWVDWKELAKRIPIDLPSVIPEATAEEKAKYKEFCEETEIGDVQGLEGANCRHSYGPFFDGAKNPYADREYDQSLYDKEQTARAKERQIRKLKRKYKAEKSAVDNLENGEAKTEAQTRLQKTTNILQEKTKDYYDFCEKYGIKTPQEFRLYIGR